MGEIKVKVKLENNGDLFLREVGKLGGQTIRAEEVEALVDTGAVMMLLPQDLVERLGLGILGRAIVTLANEQKVEMGRAGTILLTVAGRMMPTDCLVGPPGCEVLIGQLVMESLDLIPDPLKKTLTPRPESPYLPTLKLK
ncbi:MAG: retroviral-like aspartic protease family protein [Elusimicrobia bacterium]|nr:retroviral-like aspartic protease family protein [Elusimicrobiota bacterium]